MLYLYPFYNTAQELDDLRLDEDFMLEDVDRKLLEEYTIKFNNKALENRVKLMINTYGL